MRGFTSLFAFAQPSHYRLGEVAGRKWLVSPAGLPVAWRYTPAHLQLITLPTDPFDDDLLSATQQSAKFGRERSTLLGYSWTPTDWTPTRLAKIRRLNGDSAAKQQYIGYLKERYAYSIERVNQIYGLESTSFSDLLTESFDKLDPSNPAIAADDHQFLLDTASRLAEALRDALQDAHPGALLFTEPLADPEIAATVAGTVAGMMAKFADVLVSHQPLPSAKAQVLLRKPPQPLPPNVVGLSSDITPLEQLLPIPKI